MENKILAIVNPRSGMADIGRYIDRIEDNLKLNGYEVDIKYTTREYNATKILEDYDKEFNIILACGGDGTLNETIEGLYERNKDVKVCFIPSGTTNDFAKSLNISFNRLHISKYIKDYEEKVIDTGILNGRVFNYVVSFGVFSKTSYDTSVDLKNKIGRLAYILNGLKEVFNIKKYKLKFKIGDVELEDEFVFGSISNSHYIGGFKLFRKNDVAMDDGKLEVVLVKPPKNFLQVMKIIFKMITGNLKDENILFFQSPTVEIKSEDEIFWSVDGECGGDIRELKIFNKEKNVRFITPKKY
ncbi:MAG: diacylglycerol kinase family lipid kinase [Clostridia bacterium]|nr:diacylglycerol kinase family lipid kinase [Clostridia bacterium]